MDRGERSAHCWNRHNVAMTTTGSTVRFMEFRSSFKSWNDLFSEAAAFATTLGLERLISILHSEDQGKGVVLRSGIGEIPKVRKFDELVPHSAGAFNTGRH